MLTLFQTIWWIMTLTRNFSKIVKLSFIPFCCMMFRWVEFVPFIVHITVDRRNVQSAILIASSRRDSFVCLPNITIINNNQSSLSLAASSINQHATLVERCFSSLSRFHSPHSRYTTIFIIISSNKYSTTAFDPFARILSSVNQANGRKSQNISDCL